MFFFKNARKQTFRLSSTAWVIVTSKIHAVVWVLRVYLGQGCDRQYKMYKSLTLWVWVPSTMLENENRLTVNLLECLILVTYVHCHGWKHRQPTLRYFLLKFCWISKNLLNNSRWSTGRNWKKGHSVQKISFEKVVASFNLLKFSCNIGDHLTI